jgi:signal peptidase I
MAHSRNIRAVLTPALTMAALFAARASLADHYTVPSGSMEPTVLVGDHVCVDKRAYGLRVPASHTYLFENGGPARGDVVVLTSPTDGEVLLKRVVAVPGDEVSVSAGRLTINHVEVPVEQRADHIIESLGAHRHELGVDYGGGPDLPPTKVPERSYLVLGDNRGNSRDGRYFGWVERSSILGRASAVCVRSGWPVRRPL